MAIAATATIATLLFVGVPYYFLRADDASNTRNLAQSMPVGAATQVLGEDLSTQVRQAVDGILGAPAFESSRLITFEGTPAMSTWVVRSQDGHFEAVQFTNPATVLEMYSLGGPPPSLGAIDDSPEPVVALISGDNLTYRAGGETPWRVIETSTMFSPVGVDLQGMAEGDDDFFYTNDEDVVYTRQSTEDGGRIWTLTKSGSTPLSQEWGTSPDGYLRYYRIDLSGPASLTLELALSPVDVYPEPPAPALGSALNTADFGFPDDLVRP